MKKEAQINEIKEKIIPFLKENQIKRAGIFGSFVRGEQNKESDVDILIEINKRWSLLDLVNLKISLENLLKMDVDLVEYKLIKPEIKNQILSEEIRII
ncbi:hypothetical protein COU58_00285 [Candidatus Pacearchaeota archaeon CG10_big_fil_rev_8_21_14_0_10_32_42]|nr:MAG: hypothetical protein COU58_00285 [Candidatus Pacearchaeota archaeon CG10_big_fil_rev_8_21_14_0_10_32_42]